MKTVLLAILAAMILATPAVLELTGLMETGWIRLILPAVLLIVVPLWAIWPIFRD